MSARDIPVTTIDGRATTLAAFTSGPILVVNVASKCGLAPQYEKLEELQRRYGDRGLVVVGVPSNQFAQEPGTPEQIKDFCAFTYDITFPLLEKARVNGRQRHPLYAELSSAPDPRGRSGRVRWNFEKFLIAPDGAVQRFRATTQPDAPEVIAAIEAVLPSANS